ncbi:MAG: hypothetical protein JWR44_3475 [Hymenobacter sp.]|nr:hypothetical protein [Hymenobacter sp.]
MITSAALQVYREFQGDPGRFARGGTDAQRAVLPERAWGMLLDFIQDLHLVQQGLASSSYAARLEHRLRAQCSGPEVVADLARLAEASRQA